MAQPLAVSFPTLYTRNDTEGLFARYAIHSKRLLFKHVIVNGDVPPELVTINPNGVFPFFVDKALALFGSALSSYITERYPFPTLLPPDPVPRGRVRMLAATVTEWYPKLNAGSRDVLFKIQDIEDCYNREHPYYIPGEHITLVDVAIIPMFYVAERQKLWDPSLSPMRRYYDRMVNTKAFQLAAYIDVAPLVLNDSAAVA